MTTNKKFNPHARHKARRFLLQALYQWQIANQLVSEIAVQYAQDENMPKADGEYFQQLLKAIPKECEALDQHLQAVLDRPLSELDPIELTILRIGAYELLHQLEIPYRVVLNEAIELAKTFGATDGHKYVNGVLDKLAIKLRPIELKG